MYKSCNDYYVYNIYILYYPFLYLSRSLFGGRDNAHPREPYNENNNNNLQQPQRQQQQQQRLWQ